MFDLIAHAAQSFGSYHSKAEYLPVIWRFAPSAAAAARELEGHTNKVVTKEPDGAPRVAFTADGWVEMAWLYQWGTRSR